MLDSTIIASIVGGIATILAVIISPIASKYIELRKASKILPSPIIARQDALIGSWVGSYCQESGKPELLGEHFAEISFNKERHMIVGELLLKIAALNTTYKAKLINVIFDGTYFKADYINIKSNVTHFGTIFGKLSSDGLAIAGPFVGYGIISEQFVTGVIKFTKIPNT